MKADIFSKMSYYSPCPFPSLFVMRSFFPLLLNIEQSQDQGHPWEIQRAAEEAFNPRLRALQRQKYL